MYDRFELPPVPPEMNRADWLTAGAAILGVAGIGVGLWWADAVAPVSRLDA